MLLSDFLRARARADRDARRLRAGRLRRLHGATGRRARPLVPRLRRPGRGREHRDGRGARDRRRAAPGPAGLPRAARPPVRLLHARVSCSPTVDLLERNPIPSEAEIRDHLAGNVCRCTGYVGIVAAVQDAARKLGGGGTDGATETAKPYVGQAHSAASRTRGYLRGLGKYVDDVQLPGTLHAAFVRSPFAHATVDPHRRVAPPGRSTASRSCSPRRTSSDIPAIATGLPRDEVVREQPAGAARPRRFASSARPSRASSRRRATSRRTRFSSIEVDYEPLARRHGRRAARSRRTRRCCTTAPSRTASRTSSTSTETSRRRSPRPTTSSRSDSTTAASMPLPLEGRAASSPTGTPARRR